MYTYMCSTCMYVCVYTTCTCMYIIYMYIHIYMYMCTSTLVKFFTFSLFIESNFSCLHYSAGPLPSAGGAAASLSTPAAPDASGETASFVAAASTVAGSFVVSDSPTPMLTLI